MVFLWVARYGYRSCMKRERLSSFIPTKQGVSERDRYSRRLFQRLRNGMATSPTGAMRIAILYRSMIRRRRRETTLLQESHLQATLFVLHSLLSLSGF